MSVSFSGASSERDSAFLSGSTVPFFFHSYCQPEGYPPHALVFTVIGFFVGKFTYDKIRKRRKNELDDLYEYKPTEEGDNINSNNNNYNSSEENKEGDHLGINQTETME